MTDVREAAHIITLLSRLADPDHVADMVAAWAATDPDTFARVCLVLASTGNEGHLRDGHAAYARGERTKEVVELEREYQRLRKAAERAIRRRATPIRGVS